METLETWEWVTIAVVAGVGAILLLALASAFVKRRRKSHLQERFGPEYDRTVSDSGRRAGEQHLLDVEKEHEQLDIRPLSPAARERYIEEWRLVEARFVNDPKDAARSAGSVVGRVLADRGYPANGDPEHQAALVGVDHPDVVERYRHGHAMLAATNGEHDTEDLRKAMIDFRSVFDELVTEDMRTTA